MRFRRRVVYVEAAQFDPTKTPWPSGVDPQPCYCASLAQDGRRCEAHKQGGRRYGIVHVGDGRRIEISRGEWIVDHGRDAYGLSRYSVYTNTAFIAMFELDSEVA